MPSKELMEASEAIRAAASFQADAVDVAAMRAMMEQQASVKAPPADVSRRDFDAGGIPATHIATPGARDDRGVLYFHGGGYVLGSLDTHAELMARVARACRAPVLGIDYRLAPEAPYPAAVDDAVASYLRLTDQGIKPEQIVLAGDSAGGGLALACLLALKARGAPLPAGAALLSPWTDLTASGDSLRSRAEQDPMISPELLAPMAALYLAGSAADDPLVSPLFGDLSGLPPLLIQVGNDEVLLDDSTRLAERAKQAGVTATLQIVDGGYHVFQDHPTLPESVTALSEIGRFFDAVTG